MLDHHTRATESLIHPSRSSSKQQTKQKQQQLLLYISYHLTTKKKKMPTTHDLTTHPLLGHLPAFLKNCQHREARTLTKTLALGREGGMDEDDALPARRRRRARTFDGKQSPSPSPSPRAAPSRRAGRVRSSQTSSCRQDRFQTYEGPSPFRAREGKTGPD